MNQTTFRLFALLLPAGLSAAFVETPDEFQFTADLDGDGRADIVVLDKSSGGYRAAYQLAPGSWTWSPARSTGMANLTGVAVGRWFTTGLDSFAVVSPAANRAHIVRADVPGGLPAISPVLGQSLGPSAIAAPDIGGPGNTVHSDLWLVAVENGSPSPIRINTLRHTGAAFTGLEDLPTTPQPLHVRSVRLKDGGAQYLAYLESEAGEDALFRALTFASGSGVDVLSASFPEGSAWTSGKLGAGALHHVLAWVPGETQFRSRAVLEGPSEVFSLGAAALHSVGAPIGQLVIADSDAGPRLVVVSASGDGASVFAYDGTNPPVHVQDIEPVPGQAITGLLPLPGGGFQLLSGGEGRGQSETLTPHDPAGGAFVAGPAQPLPGQRPAALRANVFAFGSEPFVDPAAVLLGRYSAPEWSSDPSLAGDQLSVARETFGGAAAGLGSKGVVSVGTVPMGTAFALTSQYGEALSLHSFDAGDGAAGPSVDISPSPGLRSQGFYLRFTASSPDAPVWFRLNGGAWTLWSGQSIFLHADADVAYLVRHPITNAPSAIRYASYRFDLPAHLIDSDDDRIPDFVELGLAEVLVPPVELDPLGGVDTDGDGFTDLNEVLKGTDPTNPKSLPASSERLEENTAFRMRVAPRPIDGSNGARAQVAQGIRLELFGLDGGSLGGSAAAPLATPGVIGSGHAVDNVVADLRLGLVTVLTEPVFEIATVDSDKERGREIAGLYLIPEGASPEINYTPGGGSLADETNAWLAAAQLAYASQERPLVAGNWTELDTLAGLLLERKLEEIFLARGLEGLTPGRLTLFDGRRGDTGRFAPSAEDFADLRRQLSDSLPGHDIRQLFAAITAGVDDAAAAGLRAAATAIYRVSSASANDSPPGTYLPPFDVLRAFVRGWPLPEPYASEVGISPAALAAAQAAATAILNGLPARPVASFTVIVEADSFVGACHRVTLLGSDHPVNLFSAPGIPYTPPIGFTLLPGTKAMVTGYTDLAGACAGTQLELIDIMVLEFPPVPVVDLNQNLLPDDWEWVFLLGEGGPFDDNDWDGVSNLQELLDGTDPMDPESKGMLAFDLSPPPMQVFASGDDGVILFWDFPAEYVDAFHWILETSDDLLDWTERLDAVVLEVEPGFYGIFLPEETEGFYLVRMVLKTP
jgi:hypothetical protein